MQVNLENNSALLGSFEFTDDNEVRQIILNV